MSYRFTRFGLIREMGASLATGALSGKIAIFTLSLAGIAPGVHAAGVAAWLPVERYQEMDIIERRSYDRALGLLQKNHARAAAAEFEKMQAQFPECPALPYVLFYRGLSLQTATYRLKAVEVYREVIDYFPTDIDPAAKALYQIAMAHHENGDAKLSLKAMDELDRDERYRGHDLAAPAIRALADHDYVNQKTGRALERWNDVFARFAERVPAQSTYCRDRIANHYLSYGQVDDYVEWVTPMALPAPKVKDPEAARALWIVTYADDLIWAGIVGNAWKLKTWSARRRDDVTKAGYRLLRDHREAFVNAHRAWDGHVRELRYAKQILKQSELLSEAIAAAVEFIEKEQASRPGWGPHQRAIWMQIHYGTDPAVLRTVVDGALAYIKGHQDPAKQWELYTALQASLLKSKQATELSELVTRASLAFAESPAAAEIRWGCYTHLITSLLPSMGDAGIVQRLFAKARAFAKDRPTAGERDQKAVWLSDQLKAAKIYDQALGLLADVSHKALRLFKTYEIVGPGQEKWNEAVEILLEVEATNDAHYEPLARETRAKAYKNQLKDYEKAIALYYEISDPPRTLWEVQDCFYRWKKLDEAITTLKEIEAIFPTQASAAAWKRTQYYHNEKNRDGVIVEARRILKIYRQSRESSQAHQLLEEYGIATGGGVMDNE
ncbi:MAG: hypothetical protein O2923_11545 [Verrucomicrobia bacterium]|nr:hypothetical protein [Verrucomicrobiota bacterium]MDA1087565.1 hypothetical protein [Verrucomicrobiota bacterium]